MFENRVLGISESKKAGVSLKNEENCITRRVIICALLQTLL
jgi:hypothetical protein